ncbi:DUF3500 domain-containing protein [Komagataeibacter swingsii]|uniref:DUF3500 domain-containing protein n=1 Tax=Komagataeibacter swingsii TaxID=215220 RepID=A0A2V4QVL1_9PROT|nr:DUF3500 domain-containing protein [Komagataeibacter swingsii]PYD68571.1 hypothetical protein CFR76_14430 [Komagataeibacter swingsii]GBQ57385.1 hypothetical protein AA16373_0994 [Komagataeibacter swingsii DSM 16373]
MRKISLMAGGLFLATLPVMARTVPAMAAADLPGTEADQAASQTQAVTSAALSFLATFDATSRTKVQFPFVTQKSGMLARFRRSAPDQPVRPVTDAQAGAPTARGPGMGPPGGFIGERYGMSVWSNFPVSDVPRPGLRMGQLTDAQRIAAFHLLQAVLSPKGYRKVMDIMGGDQALADAGTPFASGRAAYTIAIFGEPGSTSAWMVQFGGHHLGLNIVIDGLHGVMTPTLTGAQPAIYQAAGKRVRVLAGENDRAFALLDALDARQRQQAILSYKVEDLVQGPGHDGETLIPEGIKGSALTAKQKELLMGVIGEWAGIINDAYAIPRQKEIRDGLDSTWFAWSGPTTHAPDRNGSSYYRIQGPRVLIEFSPQGVGDDPTMHVHTVYRDPTNDYGARYTMP